MPTWTDTQLTRWMKDAEEDIVSQVYMRFESFSLAITEGLGTYSFDTRIYKTLSVLWKGKPLSPYIGREIHAISPKFRELQGEPTAYLMSNDGISTIRLIPVPNESIDLYESGLYSTNIENAFIIRAFVFPDRTLDHFQIPDYLHRNLVKCYVLARAFHAEGIGQNLKAAEYWQSRYMFLVDLLRSTRANYFQAKETLDVYEQLDCQKKRLPRLPFGFVISGHTFPLHSETLRDSLNLWQDALAVDLNVDASIIQLELGDTLNNWVDTVSRQSTEHHSRSFSDTLNNWNDALNTELEDTFPTSGLVADYRMIEGSGQQLVDHSGNANHGTLGSDINVNLSDPSWSTDGGETVLLFDGTIDNCTLPDMTASFSGSGTFVLVVKLTDATPPASSNGLAHIGTSTGTGNQYPHPTSFDIRSDILSSAAHSGITGYSDLGVWHVILVTSTSNDWNWYMNNSLLANKSTNTFGIRTVPVIGFNPSGNEMLGMLARCCFWNKVLSADERLAVYNAIKIAKPGLGLP